MKVWTAERVAAAKKILAHHTDLLAACADVAKALSLEVTPDALQKAFKRNGEECPPSSLLKKERSAEDEPRAPTPAEWLKGRVEKRDALRKRHAEGLTQILIEKVEAALSKIAPDTISVTPEPPAPVEAKNGAPEVLWVECSDVQLGTKVESEAMGGINEHDWRIFLGKLAEWEAGVIETIRERRAVAPIEKVVVAFGGDMVEGHSIFKGQAYELDQSVWEQVVYGARDFAQSIERFAATFPDLRFDVIGVGGNHGRIGPYGEAPYRANFDKLLYHIIECRLSRSPLPNVTFDFPEAWFQIVQTWGWNHLLVHGDDVKGWGGLPFYGLQRAIARNMQMFQKTLHYMHIGHFHTEAAITTSAGSMLINGAWPGTSMFAAKQLNESGTPLQMIHGFTEEGGLVWSKRILLRSRKESRPKIDIKRVTR